MKEKSITTHPTWEQQADVIIQTPQETLSLFAQNDARIAVMHRPERMMDNGWITVTLILLFILVTFTFDRSKNLIIQIKDELFTTKSYRSFSNNPQFLTSRSRVVLLYASFIMQGLILSFALPFTILDQNSFITNWLFCTAFWLIFYFFTTCIYRFLSYIFLPKIERNNLPKQITNLYILRGIAAFVLAILVIYANLSFDITLYLAFFIFILSRLLFITHCLNNFLSGLYQIIYVVLYLCALELAPLWVIYKGLF